MVSLRVITIGIICIQCWGFGYKRSITIDHTKCGSGDSTNFPVLVYISDATFKTVGNGGHVQSSSGNDILFYSDSGGTTQIASEIDGYTATTGVVYAWVKVSTLSVSSDTVIYVFYGDSSPPSRTTGAWNSNFRGVWHFGDGSSVTNTDSSGNSHTLTNNNVTATTGQIYGAGSYNGTTAYMTLTPDSNLKPTTLSVSMWAKFTNSLGTEYPTMMGTGASIAWMWYHTGSMLYESIGNYSYYASNSTTSWGGTWKHIVMTSSSSTNVKVYINGSLSNTGSASPTIDYTNSGEFSIGRYTGVSGYFTGVIDEVHVVGSELSSSWITAEYNNQNSPSTFITLGAETALGGGGRYRLPMMGVGA